MTMYRARDAGDSAPMRTHLALSRRLLPLAGLATLAPAIALAPALVGGCGSGSSGASSGSSGTSSGSSGVGSGSSGASSTGSTTGSSTGAGAGTSTGSSGASGTASGSAGAGSGGSGASGGAIEDAGDAGDATTPKKEVLYANSGLNFNAFDLDPTSGVLTPGPSIAFPGTLQFASFDSTYTKLYAGVGAAAEPAHSFYAFAIDPTTGALTQVPAATDAAPGFVNSPNGRIINLTLSRDDKYLLAVHNVTEAYTVFQLNTDGTIGARVPQADGGDVNIGAFLHQIRVDPSNQYATICDRGNDPTYGADGGITQPEEVGHLRVFTYANGVLTPLNTLTFPTGIGPRHLDFHPTKPWVYLSAERGNRLITYSFASGVLTQMFDASSVALAADMGTLNATEAINGQRAGAIKVHPSGKFLWITNRNYALEPYTPEAGTGDASSDAGDGAADAGDGAAAAPTQVFIGGENNVALFSIDQTTGEPTFVSAADSHGFEPRTFTLDPSGNFVVVGNQKDIFTATASGLVEVKPNLSVFSVGLDGTLTFVKTYPQTTGEVLWVDSTALPQ